MREVGAWRLNEDECTLTQGDTTRQLSPRSMCVLVALIEKCGQVVTSQELQERFWPNSYSAEHGLHKAISAFGDDPRAPRYIKTFARRGHSFTGQQEDRADPVDMMSGAGDRDLPPTPPGASVAVLPFVNISGDPGNEYFSDGLTEELLNVLSNIKELKVAARTSSFHFKGRAGAIADIARRLGVAAILEGSVRQSSTRKRITAQLISAADGFHLWSETFDRVLDDIFEVQDEIAAAVANALKIRLLDDDVSRLTSGGTNNKAAFQACLLAEHHRYRGDIETAVRSAIDAFERALALDPEYAKAWAGLARSWFQMAANSYCTYEEGTNKAEAAANKAIELAPDLADAYMARTTVLGSLKQDFAGAREAINRALELNPGNAEILMEYARGRCYHGDAEVAIAAARRALDLDPVSLFANHLLGHILYFSRHYDEAIAAFQHTLEMDPQYPKPHYFIAMSLYWLGDVEAAWEEIQKEPVDWMRWAASSVILHRLGRIEEAEANFANISTDEDQEFAAVQRADTYVQWGDLDKAFKTLELAFATGDPGLYQLAVDPFLDPIRDDPRYLEMIKRLKFDLAEL